MNRKLRALDRDLDRLDRRDVDVDVDVDVDRAGS